MYVVMASKITVVDSKDNVSSIVQQQYNRLELSTKTEVDKHSQKQAKTSQTGLPDQ